jgi:hypothetical protein
MNYIKTTSLIEVFFTRKDNTLGLRHFGMFDHSGLIEFIDQYSNKWSSFETMYRTYNSNTDELLNERNYII